MSQGSTGRRRWSWGVFVAGVVVSAALVVISLTAASGATSASPRVLRYVATVSKVKILHTGGVGSGGVARYTLTLPGSSKSAGTVYQQCTAVWDQQNMCTSDFAFDDTQESQITLEGVFSNEDDVHVIPVVGGSGAYEAATGQSSWVFFGPKNNKAHVTITLTGSS